MNSVATRSFLQVRRLALFLIYIILMGTLADPPVNGASHGDRYSVGYRVIDLPYHQDGRDMTLTVAVWYPTAAEPKPHTYGGPTKGRVAVGAPPTAEGGPYPVLVFSHGFGGDGLSAVFFTEALAARGWIVAAPDHHDSHSAVRIRTGPAKHFDRLGLYRQAREIASSGPEDRGRYRYRLDELRRVIEGLSGSGLFGKLIDTGRLAVGGHSLGGFTALGLSGPVPEFHDPRLKAVLLFSTGAGGYLFRSEELARVRIPSMLFLGEEENHQRRGHRTMEELSAKIFGSLPPPKYFLELKGAGHFAFNNRFTDRFGTGWLGGTEEQFEEIRRYGIAFLEEYVAGRPESGSLLERSDPRLSRYAREAAALQSGFDLEGSPGGNPPAPPEKSGR